MNETTVEELLSTMYLSRFFEEKVEEEFKNGTLRGTTHLSIGQEASHVGLVKALKDGDIFIPTHRSHGYVLSSGANIRKMFSELLGSRDGLTLGLGGSMHMVNKKGGAYPPSSVVASGVGIATGIALAMKREKKKNISVAIFGDGASSRGIVHESMNIASLYNLPVLFYLENNYYGMSTPLEKGVSVKELYKRGDGYSIKSAKIDGNDVEKVYNTVKEVRSYILKNKRPFFLEVDTYRENGHSKSDKMVYRSREEEALWKEKDPILLYKDKIEERNELTKERIRDIEREAKESIDNAWNDALKAKDRLTGKIKMYSLSDNYLKCGNREEYKSKESVKMTYRDAIKSGLSEILSQDDRSFLIGEDIAEYGGCFGVTKDLYKKYPESVYNTPVSEEGITSLSVGASICGESPILEIMYSNFLTLSSDAILNYACNARFLSDDKVRSSLIIRTANGGGMGYGPEHSSAMENMFLSFPSLVIVAPSFPRYARSLLISSYRAHTVVLFLEHKGLYDECGMVGKMDYFPLGKARVFGKGRDLLVIGYSRAFVLATKIISEKEATFIDLMTIKPLDEKTIIDEAKRHKKILIVQDAPLGGSVADNLCRILLPLKDKKIEIVAGKDSPIPFSKELEEEVLVSKEKILKAKERLLK